MSTCRECGCTDERACPGGCWWVEPDLCSACADDDDGYCECGACHTIQEMDSGCCDCCGKPISLEDYS